MTGAGIHDGDLAVVRSAETAEHRQIVVAIVGDNDAADDATIKRYIQNGATARLEAEHPDWQPIEPPFRIVGVVTGLMRRL
jgi:repressor LexA